MGAQLFTVFIFVDETFNIDEPSHIKLPSDFTSFSEDDFETTGEVRDVKVSVPEDMTVVDEYNSFYGAVGCYFRGTVNL